MHLNEKHQYEKATYWMIPSIKYSGKDKTIEINK